MMRDAREDPKTQVVAVSRNPTKTSTARCVGLRYTNVDQCRFAEEMTDDAYYKAKIFLKSVDKIFSVCYNKLNKKEME